MDEFNLSLTGTTAKPCPECSRLQISGTFVPSLRERERGTAKKYRAMTIRKGGTTIHGESDSLVMARAFACGTPGAKIYVRKDPMP